MFFGTQAALAATKLRIEALTRDEARAKEGARAQQAAEHARSLALVAREHRATEQLLARAGAERVVVRAGAEDAAAARDAAERALARTTTILQEGETFLPHI